MGETSSRVRKLGPMVAVACVALAVGLVSGRFVRSPEQQAADSAAPPLTPVTDVVQLSVVTHSLAAAATVQPGRTTPVALTSGSSSGETVVSAVRVKDGQAIVSGQVVLELSGRPIFVLPGQLPAYRIIMPGQGGPDVVQLQTALRGLGLLRATEGGMGPATQSALASLYRGAGYSPCTVGEDEATVAADAASAAEEAQIQAQDAVTQAQTALRRARRPLSGSAAADPSAVQARADGIEDALRSLAASQRALVRANEEVVRARKRSSTASAAAGTCFPMAEVVYVPTLPARAANVSVGLGSPGTGIALDLVSGSPVAVISELTSASSSDVTVGMRARILASDGTDHAAKVTSVTYGSATSNEPAVADTGSVRPVRVVVTPDGAISDTQLGTQVRVLIHLQGTASEVLNVAVGAVFTNAAGSSSIAVQASDGSVRIVDVATGAEGDGRVQVTPTTMTETLSAGDVVLIGQGDQGRFTTSPATTETSHW